MANTWLAGDEVTNTISDLIANFHPHLAVCDKEILVYFKEKAGHSGDVITPSASKKANPQLGLVSEVDWKFVIEIADDEWRAYTDAQRVALLDHALCALRVDEDQETHVLKYSIAKPDVFFYKGEIERRGFWRAQGSPKDENLILELFGPNASKI